MLNNRSCSSTLLHLRGRLGKPEGGRVSPGKTPGPCCCLSPPRCTAAGTGPGGPTGRRTRARARRPWAPPAQPPQVHPPWPLGHLWGNPQRTSPWGNLRPARRHGPLLLSVETKGDTKTTYESWRNAGGVNANQEILNHATTMWQKPAILIFWGTIFQSPQRQTQFYGNLRLKSKNKIVKE